MKSTTHAFKFQAKQALKNVNLQNALARSKSHFIDKRRAAVDALPEFESLRQRAREIKEHTLAHLDSYLEDFEKQVLASGGQVHWAETPKAACDQILSICQAVKAQYVTKGKSMISEEIALNSALTQAGIEVVETDLGEYIIQLAKEPPSHIIAPAVHKTREEVADLFYQHHGKTEHLTEISDLVKEARKVLRSKFLRADVGITGANFLIAETGSTVIVTNEGNGDLTNTLPRVHIVVASIEKIVPTLEDCTTLLRVLARSATGQEMTTYTTFSTGPRRSEDLDGPEEFHIVLLDNGRSDMLGNEFHDMLRCIRCGACLNHCPVYGAVGGHAYGWVYPGPMGSVLTPLLLGIKEAENLPNASTLCGRCEEVCPMQIPLPKLLHHLRTKKIQNHWLLNFWAFFAKRPRLYHRLTSLTIPLLNKLGLALDMPQEETFMTAWKKKNRAKPPNGI